MLNSTAIGTPIILSKCIEEPYQTQKRNPGTEAHTFHPHQVTLPGYSNVETEEELQKSLGQVITAKERNKVGINFILQDGIEFSIPKFLPESEFWLEFPNYCIQCKTAKQFI